jgi:hypothetical protein
MRSQHVRMIKNFYCPSINSEVHIEYLSILQYQAGQDIIAGELVFNPDCERKEQCGIACREQNEIRYDWSRCLNPELKASLLQKESITAGPWPFP